MRFVRGDLHDQYHGSRRPPQVPSGGRCALHETPVLYDIVPVLSLSCGKKGHRPACMGSSVFLQLKDGRKVSLLSDADKEKADAMQARLEERIRRGETLVVVHATGTVEDITPHGVQLIEVAETLLRTNLDSV
jgi:hypothetical protein